MFHSLLHLVNLLTNLAMGNCLKKTKVVEPTEVKDNVSEMLSRGTPFAKPDGQQQADMIKDLKDKGNFETAFFFQAS